MLVLRIAINQAAIALHEALRKRERERIGMELEQRVALRTAELMAANRQLLLLQDELAAELQAMTRLHEFSTRLWAIAELPALLEEILTVTIEIQQADFGNVQLYNPQLHALEIAAQRGFNAEFLEYFALVDHDERHLRTCEAVTIPHHHRGRADGSTVRPAPAHRVVRRLSRGAVDAVIQPGRRNSRHDFDAFQESAPAFRSGPEADRFVRPPGGGDHRAQTS